MTENNLSLLYNIRYPPFRSIVLHAHQCMTVYPFFKDIPAINKFDPYYASANNPFTAFIVVILQLITNIARSSTSPI